jgi:tRNA (guanine37-N1)-methyltransferase
MTEMEQCAVEILKGFGDPACYEQMVQNIIRGKADILVACDEGVMLRTRCEGFYMLAGKACRMNDMVAQIPQGAQDVVIHGNMPKELIAEVCARLQLPVANPFVLYAYYGEVPPVETEVEIRLLDDEALDFVYANYGHASKEYLADRIANRVMLGAYVDGQLAAFIGEHAEGAMGLLHVMPEFRRHHLGYKLELADIRRTMLCGFTPFCQVFPDNIPSHRLQERLGMTRAQGEVYWLCGMQLT